MEVKGSPLPKHLLSLGGCPTPPSTFRSDSILVIHTRTLSCLGQRNSGIMPCAPPRTGPPLNSWGVYTKRRVGQNTGPNGTSQSQGAQPTIGAGLASAHNFELEKDPPPSSRAHLCPAPRWLVPGTSIELPRVFPKPNNHTFPPGRGTQAPAPSIPVQVFHHVIFWDPPFSRETSLCSGPEVGGRVDRLWGHLIGSFWALEEELEAKRPARACHSQDLPMAAARPTC